MKQLIGILFFILSTYAVQIEVSSDTQIKVTPNELSIYKKYIKEKYHYIITDDKGARKLLEENKKLANAFIKSKYFNTSERLYLKIMIEDYLADRYVKKLQQSIKIPKKVVFSYYLDNKEKFKQKDKVYIIGYAFKNYKNAMEFYRQAYQLHDDSKIDILAKRYGGVKKDYGWKDVSSLKKSFSSFIQKGQTHYLIPPFIHDRHHIRVYYIRGYKRGRGYIPFEKVRKQIEEILYAKTFEKKREEILKHYQ